MYQALGGTPPDYLAQPIAGAVARPSFTPQSAYIHPRVTGDMVRYFEWMGAARYTADRRSGSMHGKQFLLDAVHAGIDEQFVYGRLDFVGKVPEDGFELVVNLESWANHGNAAAPRTAIGGRGRSGRMQSWKVTVQGEDEGAGIVERLRARRESRWSAILSSACRWRGCRRRQWRSRKCATRRIQRCPRGCACASAYGRNRLPVDALPVEGWIELELLQEEDLTRTVKGWCR